MGLVCVVGRVVGVCGCFVLIVALWWSAMTAWLVGLVAVAVVVQLLVAIYCFVVLCWLDLFGCRCWLVWFVCCWFCFDYVCLFDEVGWCVCLGVSLS